MSIKSMQDFLDRKNGDACQTCGAVHDIQKPCAREVMAFRIAALTQANLGIPDLLRQKKEAVDIASTFQSILLKADEAHDILMQLLDEYGDIGAEIKREYLARLDRWAPQKPTKQDTSEQLSLFDQERLTSKETKTKDSTKH